MKAAGILLLTKKQGKRARTVQDSSIFKGKAEIFLPCSERTKYKLY